MPRFPIDNIVFELTGACNQCCRFCYNHWRDGRTPIAPPDPSAARKTLKTLLSQASVRHLSFSGGEPLLLSNVHDLVLQARFKGCKVNILTNGTLLTAEALDNFLSLGVGVIQIPLLSADASIHDYLTSLPGSWEKATAALRRTGHAGIGAAVLVITQVNASGVTETLSLLAECGIKTVMVNRFNLGGNGIRNARELVPDRKTLQDAFAATEAFAETHHIRFTKCSTDLTGRPVTVNDHGDVRFCNHSPKVLGNIHSRPIGDILTDPDIKAWYAGVPEECGECALLQRCGGGCRAASEQVHGTFTTLDPILVYGN